MFSFLRRQEPKLEFLFFEDDLGNIPEPYPARKLIPSCYKVRHWIRAVNTKAMPAISRCNGYWMDHTFSSGCIYRIQ